MPAPLRRFALTEVMRVRGVPVYVHWTLIVTAGVILLGAFERPGLTLVVLSSYIGVLLIHECGHLIAAHSKGCEVLSIKLYPIFGITYFQEPWSRWDRCVISWGGVLAQVIVAFPLVAWFRLFGYSRFEPMNAMIAILGFFSLAIAAFNLLPIAPLDGATAWGLIPALAERGRARRKQQTAKWRHR
jgi:Zn-dependent protease